ncbi:MAG: cell division protein FtsL [Lachnospiraceae bacterium]|nr:cell division protein FtsL [Lachnospiraceae bacterium]
MERARYANGRQAVYQTGRAVNSREYIYGSVVPDIKRELEEAPRKKLSAATRKNREKAKHMNLPYVLFLFLAMATAIVMLTSYIRANAEVVNSVERIASLESQYLNLKADNDEEYNRIVNSVDLNEVKRIAQEELGMHYATEGQIITYTDAIGDYVKQYSDID